MSCYVILYLNKLYLQRCSETPLFRSSWHSRCSSVPPQPETCETVCWPTTNVHEFCKILKYPLNLWNLWTQTNDCLTTLPETNIVAPWKWMVGRLSCFLFLGVVFFWGVKSPSGDLIRHPLTNLEGEIHGRCQQKLEKLYQVVNWMTGCGAVGCYILQLVFFWKLFGFYGSIHASRCFICKTFWQFLEVNSFLS